jgi:hypothetical protein
MGRFTAAGYLPHCRQLVIRKNSLFSVDFQECALPVLDMTLIEKRMTGEGRATKALQDDHCAKISVPLKSTAGNGNWLRVCSSAGSEGLAE